MMNADEIRNISFSKGGLGGYKAADVDEFCYQVANDFESLENTNRDLVEKLKILAAHIEKLKENEESVKTCMLNAQITADRVMREAELKSGELIAESEAKADAIVKEAQNRADYIFDETKKKSEEFLNAAKEKGDAIIAEAENQAIVLRNETDKKIDVQKQVYERLKKEILEFRDSSIDRCEKQLEILKNISDSELILDSAASEATANEEFSEKFVEEDFVPVQKEEQPVVEKELPEIDEIPSDEEDEAQGSFFEFQQ